ncbi:hypothetical protein ELH64_09855 [Rhizobium ruizarguesonis]|nr:hypothetical protein ELH64_09855 [Rhizobium ruizarguesonis]TBC35342.1 hypothetical protein ELH33_09660 [Rhizobium ruizarguesonis]
MSAFSSKARFSKPSIGSGNEAVYDPADLCRSSANFQEVKDGNALAIRSALLGTAIIYLRLARYALDGGRVPVAVAATMALIMQTGTAGRRLPIRRTNTARLFRRAPIVSRDRGRFGGDLRANLALERIIPALML